MTLDKRTREQLLAHCGRLHDDDGVDPREFFKSSRPRNKTDYKAKQLCGQIRDTLSLVLAGEFDDEILHNLYVVSVEPAPDASQLAVTLRAEPSEGDVDAQDVLNRLARVAGRLRCEVAASITRKRVPRLMFRVIQPS